MAMDHDVSESSTLVPPSTVSSDTTPAVLVSNEEQLPSTVGSSTTPAIVSSEDQIDPTEYPDIEAFVNTSCGCDLAPGNEPCSGLFSVQHYVTLRAQCCLLSKDELDMVLMGSIMSTINNGDHIHDGRHKPAKRQRVTVNFMHESHKVCKKTFLFLHGIGKKRLQTVKSHYQTNGLEQREHGNKRNSPHNYSYDRIISVHKFLINYAEENAILLPGRIPGHKRDDIKLLPSSRSKKVLYKMTYIHLLQIISVLQFLHT